MLVYYHTMQYLVQAQTSSLFYRPLNSYNSGKPYMVFYDRPLWELGWHIVKTSGYNVPRQASLPRVIFYHQMRLSVHL